VEYWEHPFPGNQKVIKCRDRAALETVLDKVYARDIPTP
jgi:D-aspartate ligase